MKIILIEKGEEKQLIHILNKRNKVGILLTTILTLSILFSNIIIVNADRGGTGKFLRINFVGEDIAISECQVIVTKSSEYNFTFSASYNPEDNIQRMAAGTVKLTAISDDGWDFIRFEVVEPEKAIIQEDPDHPNVAYFKNIKYGEIDAIFIRDNPVITVLKPSGEGNIAWGESPNNWYAVGKPSSYDISVDYGSNLTFEFIPEAGKHVSAIIVNDEYVYFDETDTATYEFINIIEDQNITAVFEDEGIVMVPEGDSILFIGSTASLSFTNVQKSGIALGIDYTSVYSKFAEGSVFWEIRTNASYAGTVTITLKFNENKPPIYLERADWVGDFNVDGKITGEDVSIIANAVNTNQQPDWYDPFLDVNSDGEVDKHDVHLVNSLIGQTIENLEWEDLNGQINNQLLIIFGETSQFSIFRCR